MRSSTQRNLTALRWILAAGIVSTGIHYAHNFVMVDHYPGPHGLMYTLTRVAIVVSWPLLTAIGVVGYRRYAAGRVREARACLRAYSALGIVTIGHFLYGNPHIPALFYATIFTDAVTGFAVLVFALRATSPSIQSTRL
jgi:hypothetical protein